jgi:uncharacterized ubiquitin-like protein YukD|eukprot:CAMPEP_0174292924 /NCGR_PEP_ID=MMETSP0809-20121228/36927_1 /TAXON_ID=73025 ORGANISM="Eutreptiella gymnastica-like, Strain CCMP1594" /NCGR_SAMPLE_ID=MMETSP0809 /ASSEMBLY_ACC=CAM_ASM_000658 /LENGTH=191 /DNA_ID=CAMNT_0015393323 /DNA_START=95 /DNA_END=670 /DNA_ORIENTATION=-
MSTSTSRKAVILRTINGSEVKIDLNMEPETYPAFRKRVMRKMQEMGMAPNSGVIRLAVGDSVLTADCDLTKCGVVDGAELTLTIGESIQIKKDFYKRDGVCVEQLSVWPATKDEFDKEHKKRTVPIAEEQDASQLADQFEKTFGKEFHTDLLEMLRDAGTYVSYSVPMHMGSQQEIFCGGHYLRRASYAGM